MSCSDSLFLGTVLGRDERRWMTPPTARSLHGCCPEANVDAGAQARRASHRLRMRACWPRSTRETLDILKTLRGFSLNSGNEKGTTERLKLNPCCGCPRNCDRRVRCPLPLALAGKAASNADPRARRPATRRFDDAWGGVSPSKIASLVVDLSLHDLAPPGQRFAPVSPCLILPRFPTSPVLEETNVRRCACQGP